MPTRLRQEFPGAIHHVTARGNSGRTIFLDDVDRQRFLERLQRVVVACGWICHAYCLMGNHFHLLIETTDANLFDGMRRLNGLYARGFNRRHGLGNHLFGERYHPEPVRRDAHFLETAAYIALNPVRAGLCDDPAEWTWGSYPAAIGAAPSPPFLTTSRLLGYFDGDPFAARARLRRYVLGPAA